MYKTCHVNENRSLGYIVFLGNRLQMYFAELASDFAIMTDNLVVSWKLRGPISPRVYLSVMFFGEAQMSHIGASGIILKPHQEAKKCEHSGDNLKIKFA